MGNVCGASGEEIHTEDVIENSPRVAGDDDDEKLVFLQEVALFKRLPLDDHPALANCAVKVTISPGTTVIRQGDAGHEFFVIKSGTANVQVDGKQVAQLGSGDYFGENALLRDEKRSASIVAETTIEALKITREAFQELGLNTKLVFPTRGNVGVGSAPEAAIKPPSAKSPDERKLMIQALQRNQNLAAMVTLDDETCNSMIDLMWKEMVDAGTAVIKERDVIADYFYIIQEGCFRITKINEQNSRKSLNNVIVDELGTIGKGGSFGELALMYSAPRAASIIAEAPGVLWVIDRKQFKQILAKSTDDACKKYSRYLEKVPMLKCLSAAERGELSKAMEEVAFNKNEVIITQGEMGKRFYVLLQGEVSLSKDSTHVKALNPSENDVAFFGERALLGREPHAETVRVSSDSARAITVDRTSFEMLFGPLEQKQGDGRGRLQKDPLQSSADKAKARCGVISKRELKKLGLIGCGGFGSVELVESVVTGDTYALKGISKGYILKCGMQKSVFSEKDIQLMCDSPYVIHLYETFNAAQSIYFLMELAIGGELFTTYSAKSLYGSHRHTKYYAAGTCMAFVHLHERKIIYRDLKPENLLLSDKGHPKLTDMGLAKVTIGKTYTTCGTPDYFAPELIEGKGHTHSLDWWTLGILTFELLAGHAPFESPTPMAIYAKVRKGIGKIQFPKACGGEAEKFIKALCTEDPAQRLPVKAGEVSNIRRHEWYKGFDWDGFTLFTMKAPYVPPVKNNKDIGNFQAQKEDLPPILPYKDPGNGWDAGFATSS